LHSLGCKELSQGNGDLWKKDLVAEGKEIEIVEVKMFDRNANGSV